MNFTRANLTDMGLALNAKIQAGQGTIPLHITRIVLGMGSSDIPTSQTEVIDPLDFFVPIIRQTSHGVVAEVQIQITNVGNPDLAIPPLATPQAFQQIGFIAVDPDEGEILYRISQLDSPAFIPAAVDFPYTVAPIYIFSTANAETVIINVDPAGLVTVRMLGEHDNDPNAHGVVVEELREQIEALAYQLENPPDAQRFTAAIPITEDDYFTAWHLYENRGGIHAPLEQWGFTNATLIELNGRIELNINNNVMRVYAPMDVARPGLGWVAVQYQDDVWVLTATDNTSLILIRR